MDLGQIRTSIDQVDRDLAELLNRRLDLVDKDWKLKIRIGNPI